MLEPTSAQHTYTHSHTHTQHWSVTKATLDLSKENEKLKYTDLFTSLSLSLVLTLFSRSCSFLGPVAFLTSSSHPPVLHDLSLYHLSFPLLNPFQQFLPSFHSSIFLQHFVSVLQVLDDGSVSDTFTHKSLFPEDMDPLSISGTLNSNGTLVVSVRRTTLLGGLEPLSVPNYRSEAHL